MGSTPSAAQVSQRLSRTASLTDDVVRVRYIGSSYAEALERLDIRTIFDLLLHVPHRYLDFTQQLPIAEADVGCDATIIATVDKVKVKRPRPRMEIVELSVYDSTGVLIASFFNQPWVAKQIKEGDSVALSGKITFSYGFKQLKTPFYEVLSHQGDAGSYARVLPVHGVTEGISVARMRRFIAVALADTGDICDFMPARLVAEHEFMSLARALREVHFPEVLKSAEQARRRLAYDELLCLQLALLTRTQLELEGCMPTQHVTQGNYIDALRSALGFSLTDEQERAQAEILSDMAAPFVMNRLLLGDVGTGKTAVAAIALAACAQTKTQAAVMAPTSVLARQYAEKLGPVLDASGISWTLITGSTPAQERSLSAEAIAEGTICVTFGTTAILSSDIIFKCLSLVVIDEQHRFGVNQRALLKQKGQGADLLTMTATPIPRTLALSMYGDVSCSRIRNRPKAGAGIRTQVIAPENEHVALTAIAEALDKGQQAYVICPLIDDADEGTELDDVPTQTQSQTKELHSAYAVYERLSRDVFGDHRVELLHGRMSAAEKDAVMAAFDSGEAQILVSTTVVEVGVDVPNATVMLIYDADRFGLATLHQLRGRVGRGDIAGTVYLECAAKQGSAARKRLAALEASSDGFELAQLDLELRHEGELLGYKQSGGVSLKLTDLARDGDLVEWAYHDARDIASSQSALTSDEYRPLAFEMRRRFSSYFDELGRS